MIPPVKIHCNSIVPENAEILGDFVPMQNRKQCAFCDEPIEHDPYAFTGLCSRCAENHYD